MSGTTRRKLRARPLFWVAVILAVAMAAGYLWRPEGQRGSTVYSSFRTTPGGVAALARGIARLGRHTEPRITPLVDADAVRGTIVLLRPALPPSPREIRALLDRVRAGGTLLYVPRYMPRRRTTAQTPLMDSLGVRFRLRTPEDEVFDRFLAEPDWGDHVLTEGLTLPDSLVHAFRIAGGVGEGEGVGQNEARDSVGAPVLRPLLSVKDSEDEQWLAAAELQLEGGRVVLLAEAGPLSNARAADHPLAVLAVRAALAYTSEADTVFFGEYHQGIRTYRSRADVLTQFFVATPRGRGLLHLILVCFLVLACVGLRFGAPAPGVAPPDRERRSPLEHVSALGDLYRKAGATGTAALLLLARLARVTRQPPPRDMAAAETLLRRLDVPESADTALARARRGLHADPPDLTAIAAGIDEHLSRRFNP